MNTTDRRRALMLVGTAAVVLPVAACSTQQADDVVAKVAEIIQQVQAGVRSACGAAGVLIPTANSVLAVLAALVGATNPALMTAAVIAQAIQQIVNMACPSGVPTPQGRRGGGTTVNGKTVNVEFY